MVERVLFRELSPVVPYGYEPVTRRAHARPLGLVRLLRNEVPAALQELRDEGWKLAVLSNTDPDLLAASLAALGVSIDLTVTVVEAGSYKGQAGIRRASGGTMTTGWWAR
jgi:FMN phosphatase YigB (HAD superfamily)